MKKSLFVCLTALSVALASQANAEIPEMIMDCMVKDQVIIETNEGKPKRYTHYNNNFVVGDKLQFSLRNTEGRWLYAALKDIKRNKILTNTYGMLDDLSKKAGRRLYFDHEGVYYSFTDDNIYFETSTEQLRLNRYYKSDFHGLYTSAGWNDNTLSQHVVTFDCRMVQDDFGKILAGFPEN
jgi:hypothetical protein